MDARVKHVIELFNRELARKLSEGTISKQVNLSPARLRQLDCTPKVRHGKKGQFTLKRGEQWRCPGSNIPVN
jgi:hypothetical protein